MSLPLTTCPGPCPPLRAYAVTYSAQSSMSARLFLIEEERFAPLYSPDMGRPNRAVQTVLGVLVLKEMFDLTDMEALEELEFNLLWHHALRLEMEEAHLAQKTLHNFRVRLMEHDGGRLAFSETTDRMIEALGLRTGKQRLDSTHVMSNIAVLTRLGLFCETVRVFLLAVSREHPGLGEGIGDGLAQRYLKETGEASLYEDARSGEGRRRLSVLGCPSTIVESHHSLGASRHVRDDEAHPREQLLPYATPPSPPHAARGPNSRHDTKSRRIGSQALRRPPTGRISKGAISHCSTLLIGSRIA